MNTLMKGPVPAKKGMQWQKRATPVETKMSDGRASRAADDQPDLKWAVEWLVEREGQRKTAALLGVNRKTWPWPCAGSG